MAAIQASKKDCVSYQPRPIMMGKDVFFSDLKDEKEISMEEDKRTRKRGQGNMEQEEKESGQLYGIGK